MLEISVAELSRRAGVGEKTIRRAEAEEPINLTVETIARVQRYFESEGIRFTSAGSPGGPAIRWPERNSPP
jgi:hypothetical protein